MIHLVMKFEQDTPIFTGLAFAKGTMTASVASHKNKDKNGFHFVSELPVDSSEDYDGQDEVPDTVNEVFLVLKNEGKEDMVLAVYTDADAASMLIQAKSRLEPNTSFRTLPTKVHHGYPPELGDAGSLAVL